jgi:hypothetical protein
MVLNDRENIRQIKICMTPSDSATIQIHVVVEDLKIATGTHQVRADTTTSASVLFRVRSAGEKQIQSYCKNVTTYYYIGFYYFCICYFCSTQDILYASPGDLGITTGSP